MEATSLTITLPDDRATTSAFQALVTTIAASASTSDSSTVAASVASVPVEAVEPPPVTEDDDGPVKKKVRISSDSSAVGATSKTAPGPEKLEQRLGSVLCCSVCIDLPKSAVYQCTNG